MPIGKFGLEKTWRTTETGTFTFNAPGNFSVPYGKNDITVEGKGGTGEAEVEGNPNYNPPVDGNIASYNPDTGGNFAGNNPNETNIANYNPVIAGTGGNPIIEAIGGGNFAGTNSGSEVSTGFNSDTFIAGDPPSYFAGNPDTFVAGNPGSYFAGNADTFIAGDPSVFVAGTPNFNAPVFVEAIYLEPSYWNGVFGNLYPPVVLVQGSYSPASYVPGTPDGGTNPSSYFAGNPDTFIAGEGSVYSSPNPDSGGPGDPASYFGGNPDTFISGSENFTYVAGSPIYNPIEYGVTGYNPSNPSSGGNPNYAVVPGNPNYNPVVPGNAASFNPATPGNIATYNPASPAVPGDSASALGVTLPGSNQGGLVASYITPTKVSPYTIPDGATYPVVVPEGGQVIITEN